jgi:hypothetical protein
LLFADAEPLIGSALVVQRTENYFKRISSMLALRPWLSRSLVLLISVCPLSYVWAQNADADRGQVSAKGDRLLGLGINEGSIGFEQAFAAARDVGMQFTELATQWDDIEPRPGEFTNQWLDIANAYYPAFGIRLVISLNPIDTNRLRLPADLRDKPLDDPVVIKRYNKAAEYVLSRVSKSELVAFAIGNEIDGYLGADQTKWQQYERFFKATSQHVRNRRPGVTVGTKVMLPSLIGKAAVLATPVNAHADAILTTYYPLGDGFRVKTAADVEKDLSALFSHYRDKPVYLLEAGCPSSSFLGSSEARQAEFVSHLFDFWDANRQQLKVVNFIWLHDISDAQVQSYTKYYKLGQRGFAEYLGTLGLRHHDGRDKEAFTTLRRESKSRGW